MATLDLPEQLAALEEVRAELEAALGSDENWRALRRGGGAGRSDTGPDRRDRDARLTKSLEANPLFVAWTHLGDAIRALGDAEHAAKAAETRDDLIRIRGISPGLARRLAENGVTRFAKIAAWTTEDVHIATEVLGLPVGEIERQTWVQQATLLAARKSDVATDAVVPEARAVEALQDAPQEELEEEVPEAATPAAAEDADTDTNANDMELPEEIRELIRADTADAVRGEPQPVARANAPAENNAGPAAAVAAGPSATPKLRSRLASIPWVEPISSPMQLDIAERLHKLEADMDEFDEAIEDPGTLSGDGGHALPPEPKPEPPTAARRTGDLPDFSDVPTTRPMAARGEAKVMFLTREPPPESLAESQAKGSLPPAEPPRDLETQPQGPEDAFIPPSGPLEEAEVTIVKPGGGEAGPVKRFLKALSGD